MPGNRLGMDAAETGIERATDLHHTAAGARQQAGERAPPRPPHGVGDDVQLALADAIHIDQRAEVLVIRPRRVETPDQTFLNRLIVVHAVRAATFALSANQLFLDQSALLGGRAAAIGRLQLETVIARWV